VLCVTLPVTQVDVNVHPAKTQVKFAREKDVFDAVYHTVMDCLAAKGAPVSAPKAVEQTVNPRGDFFRSMDAKTYREEAAKPAAKPVAVAAEPVRPATKPAWNTEWKSTAQVADQEQPKRSYDLFRPEKKPGGAFGTAPASVTAKPLGGAFGKAPASVIPKQEPISAPPVVEEKKPERPFVPAIPRVEQQTLELSEQQTIQPEKEAPWRIAGEVLHTYIVCESEDGCVWLIDKHAAHERVNFDRLKAAKVPPMRQTLLAPIAAELGREDSGLLLENLELLEQFGFACEDFGDGAILVREVPSDIDAADTVPTLEEFAENIRSGRSLDEKRENLLHTMACKAAIKGGWVSDRKELEVLVAKVQSGEVKYCPHGRPVAVKLTKYELEKMFKRA
jgi:DNA mismatch repair protein MutL